MKLFLISTLWKQRRDILTHFAHYRIAATETEAIGAVTKEFMADNKGASLLGVDATEITVDRLEKTLAVLKGQAETLQ